MKKQLYPLFSRIIRGMEFLLAIAVLIGVIVSSVGSIQVLLSMDWRTTETYYELIYRVLLLIIGVELVRMLVVHDLAAVLELLAFVIARKMLKPDLVAVDILLVVTAFVALMWARRFVVTKQPKVTNEGLYTDGKL